MIGIFDSGLGGLTILKSILEKLPNYDYIYLGDNARAPYGSKSQDVIYGYVKEAVDFLFSQNCQLVIIACNTASSEALRKIQREYLPRIDIVRGLPTNYPYKRVLGVIRPLVEKACEYDNIKRVGVIGTKATIQTNAYKTELKNLKPNLEILQKPAPLLVPLVEEGWLKKPETKMILKKYLRPFKQFQAQILIPACTHYPFLLKDMQRVMAKKCLVLNPGEIVADSLADYLNRHPELEIKPNAKPNIEFYTTDEINKFKKLGEQFLNKKIKNIQKI